MKSTLFEYELNLITNDIIRNIVKRSLEEVVPDWYETKLASTSPNYKYSLSGDPISIVSRNKSSVALLKILLDNPIYSNKFGVLNNDMMYAALILKDLNLYGLGSDQDYKVKDHHKNAYQLKPNGLDFMENNMFDGILDYIRIHHGPYSDPPIPLDYQEYELVHLCDYLSSKTNILVDYSKEKL